MTLRHVGCAPSIAGRRLPVARRLLRSLIFILK
jgi:hypothetical protein